MLQTAAKSLAGATKRARGIDRLIDILNYLHESGRPQRANDIATGIGAPKSTVYEIVNRLVEEKFLEPFDNDGRLFLGRKLHFFGAEYLKKFDLLRRAEPIVAALSEETGETAQLGVVEGNKFIVALAKTGNGHFKIISDLGRPIPLTWVASGRLLVAGMSDETVLEFIPAEDFVLPDGTGLPPETFLAQARQANDEGFFSCDSVVDGYTKCYAAPVRDQANSCLATLCLVTPREDARRRDNELRRTLIKYAGRLNASLGGHS